MSLSEETPLASYVKGFFPSNYDVSVTVYNLEEGQFPLATVFVISPFTRIEVSHDAYLHEILDINYMSEIANYLLSYLRAATGPL